MKVLIIPSAKLINEDLKIQFGNIPSILTPINGETILEILCKQYQNNVDYILVIGKEKCKKISNIIKSKKINADLLELDELKDLGFSIYKGLEYLNEKFNLDSLSEVIVNLGDTIVSDLDVNKLKNTIVYSKTEEYSRWTIFEYLNHKIINILDKREDLNRKGDYNVFVGIYSFNNPKLIYNAINESLSIEKFNGKDSFYNAILEYNNKVDLDILYTDEWVDLGHFDKYITSKKDVQTRYFNRIYIDKSRGILTKKSDEQKKFHNEILWYLKLPKNIKYIAPRIMDYSLDYSEMSVTMEYYGYSTVNELFVFGDLGESQWKKILDSIFLAIEDMSKYKLKDDELDMIASIEDMYVNKTIERLDILKDDKEFNRFFNKKIFINGKEYECIEYYITKIHELIDIYCIKKIDCLNIIHGDLCFANILYDLQSGLIRLIDPRGSFGKYDIYGDTRYDLAKLSHSINGKYDYIIHDLFDLEVKENNINYKIFSDENNLKLDNLFKNLIKKHDYDYNQIRFIEGLLFLSMIPLHRDYPRRQYVMLATGIEILSSLI